MIDFVIGGRGGRGDSLASIRRRICARRRGKCIYVWIRCFCFGESARLLSEPKTKLSSPALHLQIYSAATEGDWYKLWKSDGSATGFYLAELVCPHSYYDDDHYCAIEFRCYLDDSDPNDPKAFSFTLHDDC